jgi:hypothetical protein
MNLTLTRKSYNSWGIISDLTDDTGKLIAVTLEHAFPSDVGRAYYLPKISAGTYQCVLGTHQLDHGGPQQLYEVTGVRDHSGILIHIGNFNRDSDGCILLGEAVSETLQSISNSTNTFNDFMKMQGGQPFILTVVE